MHVKGRGLLSDGRGWARIEAHRARQKKGHLGIVTAKIGEFRHLTGRKVLWLATWMIHDANHLRDGDGMKVGGPPGLVG